MALKVTADLPASRMSGADLEARLSALEHEVAEIRELLAASPKPKRGKQIEGEWQPSPQLIDWAAQSHPNVDVAHEADKFRDYYAAHGKPLKNWDAAFRNWVRKASEFSPAPVSRIEARSVGRAASLGESNRAKRDRALDKLAALQQGAAARKV